MKFAKEDSGACSRPDAFFSGLIVYRSPVSTPVSLRLEITETTVARVLTRTGGYLRDVASHSLQPYVGCAFGNALCGVACYVRSNPWITKGRAWGSFLEVRTNAAQAYATSVDAERRWAHRQGRPFGIFMSSSTDPFVPHEARYGITASVVDAMLDSPPDTLVVQTHSPQVAVLADRWQALAAHTKLRFHISIETDRDDIPGLPRPTASVDARLAAARQLRRAGQHVVITVSPLLPLADPRRFFERIADAADAVVIDHFIGGDGSANGRRTRATPLPDVMERLHAGSTQLAYRDDVVAHARAAMPGRVGVHSAGFAGALLPRRCTHQPRATRP